MLREGAVVLLMRTNKNIFSTLIIGLCFRTMLVNLKKYIDTFNFINGYEQKIVLLTAYASTAARLGAVPISIAYNGSFLGTVLMMLYDSFVRPLSDSQFEFLRPFFPESI